MNKLVSPGNTNNNLVSTGCINNNLASTCCTNSTVVQAMSLAYGVMEHHDQKQLEGKCLFCFHITVHH